ncbi:MULTISPECIES: TcdA/TcdB pore-forming domain-containing protein [unclassified Pseudomonas]|uniref:TcdA/TcdB pore-forming domain-containing protein n=1 Tax=unclassified Pseudomonas TaxID=196821 RepID=UPI00087F5EC9|nr:MULTISPECIES: TcdA/TcdB pore-forming domain-containing protein [unclassified Pseudomonas]SCY91069.1 virulence surface antigen [Pseudomonas sp. NFACC37-1]SFO52320.1 virulence surface antigen [Pseudomonas sp. NFACC24-1]
MSESVISSADSYADFVDLLKLKELEQALIVHKGTDEYEAVLRYYFGCIALLDSPQLLKPLGLLKQALGALQGNSRPPHTSESTGDAGLMDLTQIHDKIEAFEARLRNSFELLKQPATEVPKKLHFVWLGGGVGAIQRDYINIWKQVLGPEGYRLNLWYDSDALLAYETNRIIVEAAKADAMLKGADTSVDALELGDRYEERVIVLKQQMYAHITQAVKNGGSADDARIDLLVRAYGQDKVRLMALRDDNRLSLAALAEGSLELRDLASAEVVLQLRDLYEREISLRGMFAGGSDIVRVEVLFAEGGSYADIDGLPPLAERLGEVDIREFQTDARLGVLQLLLDQNPEWMPGRQALRGKYANYVDEIPTAYRAALERFAKSRPELNRVFRSPVERLARPDELRAVIEQHALSNAFLMAHPGAARLKTVIERFRRNYQVVDITARLSDEQNVSLMDIETMSGLARQAATQVYGALHELPPEMDLAISFLVEAAAAYYSDGIRPQSEGTIYLTGPSALRQGLADYHRMHFTPQTAELWLAEAAITATFTVNRATEEELDNSWKENERDTMQWLANEKTSWKKGQFKVRYEGDMAELLKYRTLQFDEGWPVVEGRHVLSTALLQHLADELGAPFVRMMGHSHSGEVAFDKPIPLSFDARQSIRAQSPYALPPVSLGDSQTRQLSLAELLGRLAAGDFEIAQMSPLQRLLLGALVGASALDNRSFDAMRPQLDNLANSLAGHGTAGRYAALEQVLYQRQAPAFLVGLANANDDPPRHGETALELKKAALAQPLTLRQWGRHVARIRQVAQLEYRVRIVERLGGVLDGFEADTIKLVPQDLLLQGEGDRVGGRCYPLSLAMAAALSQGKAAVNTLRERFYLGVIEPEASDSTIFLGSLESLRDVQLGDVGRTLARSDLNEVMDLLHARTSTGTLMLNSDNHAMLVAKTVEGETSTYHFYDPNFGVFEFEHPARFKQALTRFFLDEGMAIHYAAYGDAARPTFDLIELDGGRVASVVLPGEIDVAKLLLPGALPGQSPRPVRQRLASARGQSLQSNPRLGNCLLMLDAYGWSQQIEQATVRLQRENQLGSHLVPLFDTLEVTSDGAYRMNLIDPADPERPVRIVSADHGLLRIKNYLSERFTTLANKPVVPSDPTEVGSVHTLNAGFAIQALMNALRGREGVDRPLTLAVRLHAYVNYAQLVHGNVADVAGLLGLVRQALAEEKLIARTVAPVVKAAVGSSVSEATGGLLQLANVGFDIYQLATAQNEAERAQFGTQLAFDSASLVLSGGAYAVGATAAGAFLGGAAVILGGLAVGVAALAQGFASITEEAKQVGLFFDEVSKAHLEAYRLDATQGAWVPHSSLILQTLDLTRAELVLDGPRLYPLRDHFGVPTFDDDYARAIDIRRELRLSGRTTFRPGAGSVIVLPCTPQTCYRYEYKALPFATLRHDRGFDIARRLEKKKADGGWLFLFSFYSFPSDYILYRMVPDYRPTTINVLLDDVDRSLVVPVLPAAWHGKVAYQIRSAGKRCALVLHPGVGVTLESPSLKQSSWILDAPWASEGDVRFERYSKLFIGDVQVTYTGTGRHQTLLRLAKGQVFQVDAGERKLILAEADVPPGMDRQALQDRLRTLAREHRLVMPYTPIHHYLIPFEKPEEPRYITAWYDAKGDRFLYIRNDLPGAGDAVLGAVVGDACYFYDPQSPIIWQVDAVTGLLSYRYWLWGAGRVTATIKSVEADGQGLVQVVQHVTRQDQTLDVLVYVIHEGQLLLSSITRDLDPALESVLSAGETLTQWSQVLGDDFLVTPSAAPEAMFLTVVWQPAPFVSICWKSDEQWRDMAWVRRSDGLIIRPVPRRNEPHGWADSIKDMADLTLLPPLGDDNMFIIYDRPKQALCFRRRSVVAGKARWSTKWASSERLENVVAVEGGYVALTSGGLIYNLTGEGNLKLSGVNETWFKDRVQWWSALDALARRNASESLVLIGLGNFSADAKLCAWYIGNRLLLAEAGPGKEIRLVGVTPDGEAAWLFDVQEGEVYRQAFFDTRKLEAAFGQGSQLLKADALPVPQPVWAQWQFAELMVEGAGLRGVTFDGVVVALRDREPPLITGVTRQWVITQGDQVHEGLRRLATQPLHGPLLSVEDPSSLKWFVAETERLIQVSKGAIPAAFEVLGTQRQTRVLVHESNNGKLLVLPGKGPVGELSYVQREGEVLVVEGHEMKIDDLLPLMPDDVTTLVLRMGQGAVSYRLSKAVWLRARSVILDCRPPLGDTVTIPGKLIWELEDPDALLLSLVDEHLVIIDPNSGHSVIFREVHATDVSLRGEVLLSFEGNRHYAVSALVRWLDGQPGTQNGVTLKAFSSTSSAQENSVAD